MSTPFDQQRQLNTSSNSQIFPDDPFGGIKEPATNQSPLPQVVTAFHKRADTDGSQFAAHHTLGIQHNQASPGDHKHDGQNSKLIMDGVVITGSRGGNVALTNLILALASALGFTDSTTV